MSKPAKKPTVTLYKVQRLDAAGRVRSTRVFMQWSATLRHMLDLEKYGNRYRVTYALNVVFEPHSEHLVPPDFRCRLASRFSIASWSSTSQSIMPEACLRHDAA